MLTATAVDTGTPVIGLTPVTTEPILAMGRPMDTLVTAVVAVITPVQTAPATASPMQAVGSPLQSLVGLPGPVTPFLSYFHNLGVCFQGTG